MPAEPIIGMIVPPATGAVPPEPPALYPRGVRFIAEGLALERMTMAGYEAVIDRVGEAARALAAQGAIAVSLMGTSLSFYRGPAFNETLKRTITAAGGVPATTMSDAVVAALTLFGARRIAVATAYRTEVNDRLRDYLTASGFAVGEIVSLGLESVDDVSAVTDADLVALGNRAFAATPDADVLLISCGGLRTLPVTVALEQACAVPVVSSAMAGAWDAMRHARLDPSSPGHGRLFERPAAVA